MGRVCEDVDCAEHTRNVRSMAEPTHPIGDPQLGGALLEPRSLRAIADDDEGRLWGAGQESRQRLDQQLLTLETNDVTDARDRHVLVDEPELVAQRGAFRRGEWLELLDGDGVVDAPGPRLGDAQPLHDHVAHVVANAHHAIGDARRERDVGEPQRAIEGLSAQAVVAERPRLVRRDLNRRDDGCPAAHGRPADEIGQPALRMNDVEVAGHGAQGAYGPRQVGRALQADVVDLCAERGEHRGVRGLVEKVHYVMLVVRQGADQRHEVSLGAATLQIVDQVKDPHRRPRLPQAGRERLSITRRR